jgi:hypothetical protein
MNQKPLVIDKTLNSLPVYTVPDFMAMLILITVTSAMNLLPRDLCAPVLIFLSVLVLPYQRITTRFGVAIWPLLAILVIGVTGIKTYTIRDIARDFFFALTPVALFLLGFWLAERKKFWDQLPVVFISLGFIFALNHLSIFVLMPSLLLAESMVVRQVAGNVSDITILGLIILLFRNRFTQGPIEFFRINKSLRIFAYWVVFGILLASIMLSYSRTAIAVLFLMSIAAGGWLTGRHLKLVLTIVCIGLLLIQINTWDGSNREEELSFLSKLVHSLEEVSVSNYYTFEDISLNWRGFETFKTLEQYGSGTTMQWILGQGYGALVDLGFYMPLGGDGSIEFRYIPVMHNGYAYILLKYGMLGVFLYAIFFAKLIYIAVRNQQSTSPQIAFCARLLLGLTLALAFVMFVGGGMAQLVYSEFVILAGVLVNKLTRMNLMRVKTFISTAIEKNN